jgi:predicted nucleic-acid-binding protein
MQRLRKVDVVVEFLDTNPIIRYATKDDPAQAERSRMLFEEVEQGARTITTSEAVIVEAVQVLESVRLYHWPRERIRDYLSTLLGLSGFRLPYKPVYVRALELYATTKLDFVDALNVAHMERGEIQTIVSFDTHYDRVPGITRHEP